MISPRSTTLLRLLFVANFIAALVTGYLGLSRLLREQTGNPGKPLDIFYYDLQLFVLGSDPIDDAAGPLPPLLEFARFAAGATTLIALAEVVRLLLARRLGDLRTRLVSDHVIVCGAGPDAEAVAMGHAAAGRRVVILHPAAETGAGAGAGPGFRVRRVLGDPADPAALRRAGVRRAERLYVCAADNASNAAIALAARTAVRKGRRTPLRAYAHVIDQDLCAAIKARRIGLRSDPAFRLDFFNVNEIAARQLALREATALRDRAIGEVTFAIIGFGDFGQALLLETARAWRSRAAAEARRISVVVADRSAAGRLEVARERHPPIAEVCDVRAVEGPVSGMCAERLIAESGGAAPYRAYICDQDPDGGIKAGLAAARVLTRAGQVATVCLYGRTPLAETFGSAGLLDDVSAGFRVVSILETATADGCIEEDTLERLARLIHENYVRDRLARGDTPETNRALRPWSALPEVTRAASRDQAERIGVKLAAVGCTLVPSAASTSEFSFDDEEAELLSRLEHDRWLAERRSRGFVPGPRGAARHPDLVDWTELSEEARDKDRDVIRFLPALVAEAGFQIVRVERRGGR